MKFIQLYTILLLILLSACVKDININETIKDSPQKEVIRTTIQGIVLTESGNAVEGAIIVLINNAKEEVSTTTDENGFYIFFSNKVKGDIAHLRMEHPNGLIMHHSVPIIAEKVITDDFVLLSVKYTKEFNASTNNNLIFGDTQINFSDHSIVDNNGNDYNGIVQIEVTPVDLNGFVGHKRRTGGNEAVDNLGAPIGIINHGVLHIEMSGSSGQSLQIKANRTVTIKTRIEEMLQNKMDNPVLMHYNEHNRIWEQEGELEIENGYIIAKVTHFSTYSWCDILDNPVSLEGKITLFNENGTFDAKSYILLDYGNIVFYVATGQDGSFYFPFSPGSKDFDFRVLNECEEQLYIHNYNGLNDDHDFGIIEIETDPSIIHTLKAKVHHCDGSLVNLGYSRLCFDDQLMFRKCRSLPIVDGIVDYSFVHCDEGLSGTLKFIDYVTLETSPKKNVNLDVQNVDLQDLFLCDDHTTNMTVNLDGNEIINVPIVYSTCQGIPWIGGYQGGSSNTNYITFYMEPGSYPLEPGQSYELEILRLVTGDTSFYYDYQENYGTLNVSEFTLGDTSSSTPECTVPTYLKGTLEGTVYKKNKLTDETVATQTIDASILIDNF